MNINQRQEFAATIVRILNGITEPTVLAGFAKEMTDEELWSIVCYAPLTSLVFDAACNESDVRFPDDSMTDAF